MERMKKSTMMIQRSHEAQEQFERVYGKLKAVVCVYLMLRGNLTVRRVWDCRRFWLPIWCGVGEGLTGLTRTHELVSFPYRIGGRTWLARL